MNSFTFAGTRWTHSHFRLNVSRWSFIDFNLLIDKTVKAKFRPSGAPGGHSGSTMPKSDSQFRPSPRFVSSHLPFSMNNPRLLDVCKVVYVARNPKDACVSYFNHCRLIKLVDFTGDLEVSKSDIYIGIGTTTGLAERRSPRRQFVESEE